MNALSQLLSEGDGNPSTMRVATLLIVLVILGVESYAALRHGTSMQISLDEVALITAALGAKLWQRRVEGRDVPPPPLPPQPSPIPQP